MLLKEEYKDTEYDLSNYPIEETRQRIDKYFTDVKPKLITEIKEQEGYKLFDVSGIIDSFLRVDLDDKYRLLMTQFLDPFHGHYGEVFAFPKDCDTNFKISDQSGLFLKIESPEEAVDPAEVLYHDGTPFGCLEATLVFDELHALPWRSNAYPHKWVYINSLPENFDSWEQYAEIRSAKPKLFHDCLYVYKRKIETGRHASDGRDEIYLCRYVFHNNSALTHLRKQVPEHIKNQERYKNRGCCVIGIETIEVAKAPGFDRYVLC